MSTLAKAICIMATIAIPIPLFAQGASTTAFDGTYRGVSRQVEGGPMGGGNAARYCQIPNGVPGPLTIVNGVARAGSAENPLEGSVTPQGVLTMRTKNSGKFEGQIDGQGRVVGHLIFSCSYQYVWQRG
jgi:hypothetical protein